MKRTVEIDDDLQERVDDVKYEILENFKSYFNDNPDMADFDEYYQETGCDSVHEFADSSTPIYYSDIDGLYYLYGNEFDEAYSNAGIGDGSEDNHRQVAIYCYLSEKGFDYLKELETAFDEWLSERDEDYLLQLDDEEWEMPEDMKKPWDYL